MSNMVSLMPNPLKPNPGPTSSGSMAKDDGSTASAKLSEAEKTIAVAESDSADAYTAEVDPKKVLLKMDLHLIPMLALLYLLSFLDRGNIGNARIEGLTETLHMTGPQYNWARMSCRALPT